MTAAFYAKILLIIVALATLMGLIGVWFPDFWKSEIGPKLFYSFIVVAVGVAIACGVLKFLPLN